MPAGPSLYRRHRPRSFSEVVGQAPVVRTLRNAVEQGKVHHAYLFVGSRGTGKTSMAKILAACLNCENGPTIEPCGVCDSCASIASATSLDVIEMDAASNNSVDDIRELRERVAFAPVSGRCKVYILDEAHMLSTQAWNAFLKTLEEPPPSTIFVLATTEAQKVPATVVDRCHRFDFARPSVEELAEVLRRTAVAESIDVPEPAVGMIARNATGSFRDALGTLEQLVTYGGGEGAIALDDVLAVLGVADADLLFDTVEAVIHHDARSALQAAARLADSGRDVGLFFRDLEGHARELLVVGTLGEVPRELQGTPEHDERLESQAKRAPGSDVVRLLELLAAGQEAVKAGAEARVQLELALVKAAAPEVDASTRALLARIDRLESQLATAAPATPSTAREEPDAEAVAPLREPEAVRQPPEPSQPEPPAQSSAQRVEQPQPVAAGNGGSAAVALAEPPPAEAPAAIAEPDLGIEVDLDSLVALWPEVVKTVREENMMLAALLDDARPLALQGNELTVGFAAGATFRKRKAEGAAHRETVSVALRALCGRRLTLNYELREDLAPAKDPAQSPPLSDDDLVARLKADFDAEEIDPEGAI